jgi:hypothetical protein
VLATLRALLLPEYPSHAPPLVELDGYHLPPTAPHALGTTPWATHSWRPKNPRTTHATFLGGPPSQASHPSSTTAPERGSTSGHNG